MANELTVSTDSLRAAAVSSESITAALSGGGGVPSINAGIAAMDAALGSVRRRQAVRIGGQAEGMSTGSARYETTDADGAGAIATVLV